MALDIVGDQSEQRWWFIDGARSVLMKKADSVYLHTLGRSRGRATVRVGGCSSKSGAWLPVSQGLMLQNAVIFGQEGRTLLK